MNYYTIDNYRTADTQASTKVQKASTPNQDFAEYLNLTGNSKRSTAVNPSLKQDNSILGNILSRTPWPAERDISFSNAERAIDDTPTVDERVDASPTEENVDNQAASEDMDSAANHENEDSNDKEHANKTAASDDTPRDDVTEQNTSDNTKMDATVVEASTQASTQSKSIASSPVSSSSPAAQSLAQSTSAPATVNSGSEKGSGDKANSVANIKTTQTDVTSKPMSSLTASASVTAMETQNAKVSASINVSTQSKAEPTNSSNTASSTTAANVKGSSPTQTAQAVFAATQGQNGNNTNNQSQNGTGLARADAGVTTGIKASSLGESSSFSQTLSSTSRTANTASTQSTLKSMNLTTADQVSVHIKKALGENKDSISIKLHPSELGRVDVKMEIIEGGSIKATITAERPDTLDLLQRDSRLLEKALQEAGLKTDGQSLSFNLKQDGSEQNRSTNSDSEFASNTDGSSDTESDLPENADLASTTSSHDGDLDISV
ncbi:flagellar hook-length control protein FliK [Kiloniella antarctica]|uniref:Flagellar hook-length control protein FliK n=1 Tax=Kiloniella antarctica TaxID=1550907 RepID=A0ABW5BPS1_9PROT